MGAISQDWNEVVERTLELHEAAQQLNRKGGGGRWKHHAKASDAWHSTRRASAARPSAASILKSPLHSDFCLVTLRRASAARPSAASIHKSP